MIKETKSEKDSAENAQDKARRVMADINKLFGDEMVMELGRTKPIRENLISTGSLGLDVALGGGLPRGRIIEIYGENGVGKSTVALSIAAQVQKAGGVVAYIDMENALDPEYATETGVNIEEMHLAQPGFAEEAFSVIEKMVASNAYDLIVIDSVAAMITRAELEGNFGDANVATQARIMSQALKKITGLLNRNKTSILFLNQMRSLIANYGYGPTTTTTGGKALPFYSSVRIEMKSGEKLKQGEEIIGIQPKIKVVKNKVAHPFKTTTFDLMYTTPRGISYEGELIDFGLEMGLVKKGGAWFSYGETPLGQGREKARTFLRENAEIRNKLDAEIRAELALFSAPAKDYSDSGNSDS